MFALRSSHKFIKPGNLIRTMTTEIVEGASSTTTTRFKGFAKGIYLGGVTSFFGIKTYSDYKDCKNNYEYLPIKKDEDKLLIQQYIFEKNWFKNFLESLFFPVFVFGNEALVRGMVYSESYNTNKKEYAKAKEQEQEKENSKETLIQEKEDAEAKAKEKEEKS